MAEELNWNERKQWVKVLYTKTDKSIRSVGKLTSVPVKEIRKWAQDEGWEGVKQSLLMAKQGQLAHLYNLLRRLNDEVAKDEKMLTVKQVDLMAKCTASIRNLEEEHAVGCIVIAAEQFTAWLLNIDTEFAKKVTLYFDEFIRQNLAGGI